MSNLTIATPTTDAYGGQAQGGLPTTGLDTGIVAGAGLVLVVLGAALIGAYNKVGRA